MDESAPLIGTADDGSALLADAGGGAPWWAPAPVPAEPDDGTFGFVYRVTGHDEDGSPTIAATVTLVLRFPPPPADHAEARPVLGTGLAVRLRVPFIDAETGKPAAAELPADVIAQDGGTVRCRIEIDGGIARAAYGALSTPGFQPGESAGLAVEFTFTAQQKTESMFGSRRRGELEVVTIPPKLGGNGMDLTVEKPPVYWPIRRRIPIRPPVKEHPEWVDVLTTQVRGMEVFEVAEPTAFYAEKRFGEAGFVDVLKPKEWETDRLQFFRQVAVSITREYRIPLLVPCRDHGDLYRHDLGDGTPPVPVGCQEAVQLGRIPAQQFSRAPHLDREHRWSVWQSLLQPATYLVVPAHYRVGRTAAGRPELEWLQVFDATVEKQQPCLLQARCVPDLTAAELADLESYLRADARGQAVRMLLPTSPAAGSTELTVASSTLDGQLRAVIDDDAVRLAMRVDYGDAIVAATQLRGGEAVAQVSFQTINPRLTLSTTVHLDVDDLAGPYPAGPVQVAAGVMQNLADTEAIVTALWQRSDAGWSRTALAPVVVLAPHGTAAVPVAGEVRVEARLAPADPAQLSVRNVYLENLHTVVLVRGDVVAPAGVTGLALTFTVAGTDVAHATITPGTAVTQVTLVQPLAADRVTFDRRVIVTGSFTSQDGRTEPAPVTPYLLDLGHGAVLPLSRLFPAWASTP